MGAGQVALQYIEHVTMQKELRLLEETEQSVNIRGGTRDNGAELSCGRITARSWE